ncbi:kelch repeat domain [Anaeramoeba flamelloides]|uniref:Kelch repeat domain n=1 Tax=Anaeramoeba flamelloides TaxID=1746091 RepID=A0AAV7Z9M9_9EUKA|nr:kelch repeat domain [Anaeramoeba flamelloides]
MKKNFLKETLATERTYFGQLESIVKDFLHPLLKQQIITEQVSVLIFANVQLLRDLHLSLLESFEARHKSELFTYGDIFEEFVPYLILYTGFVNNFDISRGAVESEKKKNVRFSQFLESNVRYTNCKLDLHSLLITPVQRIPRYIMLIEGLLKNLDKTHLDYPIFQKVLTKLKVLAIQVNKNKHKNETLMPLFEVDRKFRGLEGTTLIKEGRKLIKEGHLAEKTHPNPSKSWTLLFNDCIIFATNEGDTYQFRFALPLSQITIRTHLFQQLDRKSKDFYNFLILTETEGYVLTPKSQKERANWVRIINSQMLEIKKAEKSSFDKVQSKRIPIDYKKLKPKQLYGHSSCIIDENIYIFGGQDMDSNVYNDLYSFDLENEEWKIVEIYQGESPEPRTECTINAIGTYIFLFGGTNKKNRLGDFHIFLTETGEWINEPETTGTPPTPRSGHASAIIENQLWLFGGRNDKGIELDDLYCLDCNTYTWFCVEPANNLIPPPRVWHTAKFIDTNLVVYGGWSNGAVLGDLWIYDLLTSEWHKPELSDKSLDPPTRRYSHSCTYVPENNRMYVIGGNSNNGFLKDINCFHLKSLCWEKIEFDGIKPETFSKHSACHIYYNENKNKNENENENEDENKNESDENNKIMDLLTEKKKNFLILFGGIGQNSSSNEIFSLDLDFRLGGKRKIEENEDDDLFSIKKNNRSGLMIHNTSEQIQSELLFKESTINETANKNIDSSDNYTDKNNGNDNDENNNNHNNKNSIDIDIEIEIESDQDESKKMTNKSQINEESKISNNDNNNNNKFDLLINQRGFNFFEQLDQVITKACNFENKLRDIELEWRKKNQGKSFKSTNYRVQSQTLKLNHHRKTKAKPITKPNTKPNTKTNLKNNIYIENPNNDKSKDENKNANIKSQKKPNTTIKIPPKIQKGMKSKKLTSPLPSPKSLKKKLPPIPIPKRKPPPTPKKRNSITTKVSEETKIKNQIQGIKKLLIQIENDEQQINDKLNNLQEILDQFKDRYNDYLLFSGYSQFIPAKFYKKNTLLTVRQVQLNTSFDSVKNSIEQEFKKKITIYSKSNINSNSNSNSKSNNTKIEKQAQFEECLRKFEKSIRIPIKFFITFGKKLK